VAASAVQTAVLAVDAAKGGKAYGRYLTQVLVEAEGDAGAAQGTFDAIQPPDQRADELRARLEEPTEATGALIGDVVVVTTMPAAPAAASHSRPGGSTASRLRCARCVPWPRQKATSNPGRGYNRPAAMPQEPVGEA
jgi:hypothetical protein